MIREVVGAVVTAMMATLTLWYILPMLQVAKQSVVDMVLNNPDPIVSENPTTLQIIALSDYIFLGLGFMVFLVAGLIIMNYAARRETLG